MIANRRLLYCLFQHSNRRQYADVSDLEKFLDLDHKEPIKIEHKPVISGTKPVDPFLTIPVHHESLALDIPKDYRHRVAFIHQRPKNVMQQGTDNTHKWVLEFDTKERWENPCMGWTSSGDSLSNLELEFPSQCQAICYAERQGWRWYTEPAPKKKKVKKNYASIFAWNKRTRSTTK